MNNEKFNMIKKETRGGARPGAGRKKNPEKKIQISTALHPAVIKILKDSPIPIAQHIEMAVILMDRENNLKKI